MNKKVINYTTEPLYVSETRHQLEISSCADSLDPTCTEVLPITHEPHGIVYRACKRVCKDRALYDNLIAALCEEIEVEPTRATHPTPLPTTVQGIVAMMINNTLTQKNFVDAVADAKDDALERSKRKITELYEELETDLVGVPSSQGTTQLSDTQPKRSRTSPYFQ